MHREVALRILREELQLVATKFGVSGLYLFGSTARDEATVTSDVDLLVELDRPADFDRFMGLKLYLEDRLGCRVDLVTRNALREPLKSRIAAEALRVA